MGHFLTHSTILELSTLLPQPLDYYTEARFQTPKLCNSVLFPFLQGRLKNLLWNTGQREEFDLYVNCSSGQGLGDRDLGNNNF